MQKKFINSAKLTIPTNTLGFLYVITVNKHSLYFDVLAMGETLSFSPHGIVFVILYSSYSIVECNIHCNISYCHHHHHLYIFYG